MGVLMAASAQLKSRPAGIARLVTPHTGQFCVLSNQAEFCGAMVKCSGETIISEAPGIMTLFASAAGCGPLEIGPVWTCVAVIAAGMRQSFEEEPWGRKIACRKCILGITGAACISAGMTLFARNLLVHSGERKAGTGMAEF